MGLVLGGGAAPQGAGASFDTDAWAVSYQRPGPGVFDMLGRALERRRLERRRYMLANPSEPGL